MTIIEPNRQRQRWNGWFDIFDLAKSIGNFACVDFQLLEHSPNMLVAREHEQLVPLLGKVAQYGASRSGPAGVEIHEYVVENHR